MKARVENGEDSAVCYDVSSNVTMNRVCYTMVFLPRANVASELRAGLSRDGCASALAAGPLPMCGCGNNRRCG